MIVFRLIGIVLDVLLLPIRALRRRRAIPASAWLTLTIDGVVADLVARPSFWQRQIRREPDKAVSLHRLDEVATHLIVDPRIRGLVVTLRAMQGGMASATSLRTILGKIRAAGKEVIVHLPMGGATKEVYVASVANAVWLGPATQLMPLGFRSTSHYMARALGKAGVEPQIFHCGEFKSAGENLVRDSMSPEQRAQLERMLDTFHETLIDAIATGRGVDKARAKAIVDEAPYFGRAAVLAGLADDVAYDDELLGRLAERVARSGAPPELGKDGKPKPPSTISASAYYAHVTRRLVRRLVPQPVIAVVDVHGAIAHAGGPLSRASTDERVVRAIRAVRSARHVRGVILHVDSPGGSALASDLMHHEIAQLAREMPVVCCMANVAASGGYYVAAPAARIVAEPTTVTGSIGVVAARLSIEPLLARLGITTEVVERGARAGLLSGIGPLGEGDRAAIDRELDATYKQFIGVVAHGRKMPESDVERLARGRVYTGKDAFDAGLVDVLGGFGVAVAEVKKLLDVTVRDRVEVALVKTPKSPIPPLAPPSDEPTRHAALAFLASLLPSHQRSVFELMLGGERILALAPFYET